MNILLIEDDEIDARVFTDTLLEAGNSKSTHISVARSLGEAEAILEGENIDVVVLDLFLPDAKYLQGLRELASKFPKVPIIVYSGIYNSKIADEAFRAGARDYILKGAFSKDTLTHVMSNAFQRHANCARFRTIQEGIN